MALIPLLDQLKLQRKLRVVACAVSSPAADSQTEIQIKRKLRVVACAVSSPAADSQTEIQIKLQRKLRVVACAVSSPAVDSQTEIQIKLQRKLRVVACAVSSPAADSQTEIQIKLQRKLRVVACAVSSPAVDSQTEIQIKVLCFIPSFSFIYFGSLNVEQSRLCLLCYRLSETQVKTKFTLAVEFFMDRSSTWVQKKKFTEPLGSILVSVSRRHR
ncbi:uncharacterized protein LOC116248635 isoform X3 [Nymphaea colorata]|uniref:uncharacterized protein LOC116248635 isoform X3 n=1 Tax=Nymphaea colorata TaxID=210225 RepID=UPI00129EF1C4|nr:uncharacterized protein LOC116248635 isoform X3 [Nymphaea colorata]